MMCAEAGGRMYSLSPKWWMAREERDQLCHLFLKRNALQMYKRDWTQHSRAELCRNTLAESPAANGWACFLFPASQCTNTRSAPHTHRWKCEHEGHWSREFSQWTTIREPCCIIWGRFIAEEFLRPYNYTCASLAKLIFATLEGEQNRLEGFFC